MYDSNFLTAISGFPALKLSIPVEGFVFGLERSRAAILGLSEFGGSRGIVVILDVIKEASVVLNLLHTDAFDFVQLLGNLRPFFL